MEPPTTPPAVKSPPAPTHPRPNFRQNGSRPQKSDAQRAEEDRLFKYQQNLLRQLMPENILADQGFSGVPRGAKNTLYNVGDTMINVKNGELAFGSVDGRAFQSMKGKKGGAGAINMAMVIAEVTGRPYDFKTVRLELLQRYYPEAIKEGFRPAASYKPAPTPAKKEKAPEPETPMALPKKDDRYEEMYFRYLVEDRKLPAVFVNHLFRHNAIYTSEITWPAKFGDPHAKPRTSHALICPILGLETGKPVAYEHFTIYPPRKGKAWTKGTTYTEGAKQHGLFFIGQITDSTVEIKASEAPIDSMSKFILGHEDPDVICHAATCGARVSEKLIALCKQRGIKLTSANDNDFRGRQTSRQTLEACKRLGVVHGEEYVESHGVWIAFKKSLEATALFEAAKKECQAKQVKHEIAYSKDGSRFVIKMENSWDSCGIAEKFRLDGKKLDKAAEAVLAGKPLPAPAAVEHTKTTVEFTPSTEVIYRHKDWNDQLKLQVQQGWSWGIPAPYSPNVASVETSKPAGTSGPKPTGLGTLTTLPAQTTAQVDLKNKEGKRATPTHEMTM
jgi:hypothetical protein